MTPSLEETITLDFITSSSTGAAADADSTPTAEVFEDATDTTVVALTVTKRTSKTGNYRVPVACTAANGFEAGKSYNVIASATVGGVAAKAKIGTFQVRSKNVDGVGISVGTGTGQVNLSSGKVPATLASTDVTGNVAADVQTIKTQTLTCAAAVTVSPFVGSTGAAVNGTNANTLSSHDPGATLGTSTLTQAQVTGGAYALNSSSFAFNAAFDFTAAQKAATLARVTLVDTLTTYTGNTVQTGDAYARLGAPAGASHAADVAAVKSDTAATAAKLPTNAIADETLVIASTTAILSDTGTIKGKTNNLPAAPAATSDCITTAGVRNAVGLASANLDTQLAAIPASTRDVSNATPAASSLGAAVNAAAGGAGGAVTVGSIQAGAITSLAIADGAITDAKITMPTEASGSPSTFLQLVMWIAGCFGWRKFTKNSNTGTLTQYMADGSTVKTTSTYTSSGGVDTINKAN